MKRKLALETTPCPDQQRASWAEEVEHRLILRVEEILGVEGQLGRRQTGAESAELKRGADIGSRVGGVDNGDEREWPEVAVRALTDVNEVNVDAADRRGVGSAERPRRRWATNEGLTAAVQSTGRGVEARRENLRLQVREVAVERQRPDERITRLELSALGGRERDVAITRAARLVRPGVVDHVAEALIEMRHTELEAVVEKVLANPGFPAVGALGAQRVVSNHESGRVVLEERRLAKGRADRRANSRTS